MPPHHAEGEQQQKGILLQRSLYLQTLLCFLQDVTVNLLLKSNHVKRTPLEYINELII